MTQSLDNGENSEGGISDFQISAQSLIKVNCHNPRTSNDVNMKLGPVIKLEKRNKTTSKKIDYDVISSKCDVIVVFPVDGQLGAIRKPDSERIVSKTYFFINSNRLSYKN